MRLLARILLVVGVVVTCVFALMSHPPAIIGVDSDPTKHVLGIAALTILASASFPGARLSTILLWLASGSLVIEVLQGVPPFHRDPDIFDWLAGMAGSLMAMVPLAVLKHRLGDKEATKDETSARQTSVVSATGE